jgi:hypothetical protein
MLAFGKRWITTSRKEWNVGWTILLMRSIRALERNRFSLSYGCVKDGGAANRSEGAELGPAKRNSKRDKIKVRHK